MLRVSGTTVLSALSLHDVTAKVIITQIMIGFARIAIIFLSFNINVI